MAATGANVASVAGLALALSTVSLLPPAVAGDLPTALTPRLAVELGVEAFRWQEFDDAGQRLLTEQGPRYSAALSLHNLARPQRGVLYALTLRGTAGTVDYDGQDNSGRFVATETSYGGYRLEAMGGYRFEPTMGARFFDLVAAIGFDYWERDIRSSRNAVGAPVSGLSEDYGVAYARLGIGIAHEGGPAPGHLGAGVHLPLSIRERVTVSGAPLRLEPGRGGALFLAYRVSLRADASGEPFGTYLRVSYDGYRLGRSPARAVGELAVWQPESDMDVFGLALGHSF